MLKPLENRVLLLADEKVKSVVMKPETKEKERPTRAKVVAIGETYDGKLKTGDTVYFQKYGPEEIEYQGKTYYAALKEDLLVVEK